MAIAHPESRPLLNVRAASEQALQGCLSAGLRWQPNDAATSELVRSVVGARPVRAAVGELAALHRRDIDSRSLVVRVRRAAVQHNDGDVAAGPTKSEAGVRTVALPGFLRDELTRHLAQFTESGGDGLVFTGKGGGALRRGNFHRETHWTAVVVRAGLPRGFHFHDLRHTGNQLAAEVGASTRELMARMGHSSSRAALIYQHATSHRDRQIADELDRRARDHKRDEHEEPGGGNDAVG